MGGPPELPPTFGGHSPLGTEARERGIFDKSRGTMPYESPRYLTWPPYVFLVTKEERNKIKGK